MKKATMNFSKYMELCEKGRVKVGRYEYIRTSEGTFYRVYRKGDIIVNEQVEF